MGARTRAGRKRLVPHRPSTLERNERLACGVCGAIEHASELGRGDVAKIAEHAESDAHAQLSIEPRDQLLDRKCVLDPHRGPQN